MKKVFLTLIAFITIVYSAESQTSLNDQLRDLYTPLRRSVNPAPHAKFLYDMSVKQNTDQYYTAISYDQSSTYNWFQLYSEMYYSSYTPGFITNDTLLYENAQGIYRDNDKIPIGVFDFEFNRFRLDVFDSLNNGIYFVWDDDDIWDPMGFPPSPYELNMDRTPLDELHIIFAAAPLIPSYYFRDVTFTIDPLNFVFYQTNYDRTVEPHPAPHTFQVDFGDGNGFVTIDPFTYSEHNIIYPDKGLKEIAVQVIIDGSIVIKHSLSVFEVLTDNIKVIPDLEITSIAGLNVGVYLACGNSEITKPVIYLEGIDVPEFRKIPQIYQEMISDEKLKMLKNEGYDFIVVDWSNSTADMVNNAMRVVSLIEHLKCEVDNDNQFVVIGESMGGVIGRYALTFMETEAYINSLTLGVNTCRPPIQSHNTRLFISLDAPHQGANVPIAVQLAPAAINQIPIPSRKGAFAVWLLTRSARVLNNILLDRPAVKQLLVVHKDNQLGSGEFAAHQDRTGFMAQLIGMSPASNGYPVFCKKVAISNGHMNGMKQIGIMGDTLVPGSNLLDMSIFYQTRVFRLYNDFPLLDIPTLQLNTLDTTNGALAVDIHIVNHFFSLRGCLRRIFGFSFLPNGGCGHTTSNTFVTQSSNNPVGWDVMPGGTQPNMMFMPDEQDINGWIFFQFQLTPNPPNSFNINLGFGILNYTNVTIVASTEVENFCFIPLQSALDYSRGSSQEHDVLIDGTDTINARTPFDAVVARWNNIGHLNFAQWHDLFTPDPDNYPRPWVNGEIGDHEMWLDNQVINRRAHYEGRSSLIAGSEVGIIFNYPTSDRLFEESASKDNGFIVSSDSGNVTFKSANEILLKPGFVAEQGSEFRAYIDNMPFCDKTDEEIAIVLPDDQISHVEKVIFHNVDLGMKVYPNPSRGIITIVLPEHGKYCIYNQLGQVVKVFEINEGGSLEVSAEILGAGFFYLVCMDKNIKPVKFIINK